MASTVAIARDIYKQIKTLSPGASLRVKRTPRLTPGKCEVMAPGGHKPISCRVKADDDDHVL